MTDLRAFEVDLAVTEGLKRAARDYEARHGSQSPWADWRECARICAESETVDPRSIIATHILEAWREMHV